jgi:asparagine synthase (glutamine-hydrolysing)
MIHGIEIRVPFLDRELVKFTLQLPPDVKYSGALRKQLLIDSFKDILPEPIWNRPKMGFAFPFKEWMASDENVKEIMTKTESNTNNYQKFISGNMHWSQLMILMLIENRA